MSALDPATTSINDLCTEALKDSGYLGIGQTPLAEDINIAWTRLQWMLQQWERKRWMVYHLVNLSVVATGAQSYTIGPGGDIDTGAGSVRPAKLESAFLRQITSTQPNQIDYFLEILQAREDYDKIALKGLKSFPGAIFLDSAWPLGILYPWPVPQASIYEVHVSVMEQLPSSFPSLTTQFVLPYEYYQAMVSNLAMRLRIRYGIGTFPGDDLPRLAAESMKTVRGPNTQIARLQLPDLNRPYLYNIFGDRWS